MFGGCLGWFIVELSRAIMHAFPNEKAPQPILLGAF